MTSKTPQANNNLPATINTTQIVLSQTVNATTSLASSANGIPVPSYDVMNGNARIAKGRYTRLVTQDYTYDQQDGSPVSQETREYLQLLKNSACVLPMCPSENKYLLIRQFRYTAFHNALKNGSSNPNEDGWIYEVIAGVVEQGEDPEQTIIREAQEEGEITLDPQDVRKIHSCMMTPGITNEEMTIFLALVNNTGTVNQSGLTCEGERIRAKWMTPEEIRQLAKDGLIRDAKTLIALYAAKVL